MQHPGYMPTTHRLKKISDIYPLHGTKQNPLFSRLHSLEQASIQPEESNGQDQIFHTPYSYRRKRMY